MKHCRYSVLRCHCRNFKHLTLNFDGAALIPFRGAVNSFTEKAMATLTDIDEALTYLNQVPVDERGPAWRAYLDAVLDQRKDAKE